MGLDGLLESITVQMNVRVLGDRDDALAAAHLIATMTGGKPSVAVTDMRSASVELPDGNIVTVRCIEPKDVL